MQLNLWARYKGRISKPHHSFSAEEMQRSVSWTSGFQWECLKAVTQASHCARNFSVKCVLGISYWLLFFFFLLSWWYCVGQKTISSQVDTATSTDQPSLPVPEGCIILAGIWQVQNWVPRCKWVLKTVFWSCQYSGSSQPVVWTPPHPFSQATWGWQLSLRSLISQNGRVHRFLFWNEGQPVNFWIHWKHVSDKNSI